MRDAERVRRIEQELKEAQLDAIVCALPLHVLMVSGYWPVVGVSLVIATRDGRIVLLVPRDEEELTAAGWADEVHVFQPSSLSELRPLAEVVQREWEKLAGSLKLNRARIGYESGPASEPASYVAVNFYGPSLLSILRGGAPAADLVPVDDMLARLTSVKTPGEVECIRRACEIAGLSFTAGCKKWQPGLSEMKAAALVRDYLGEVAGANDGATRADGFAFCMSGPNSAKAGAAYARSRDRQLAKGDLVLVHCNSYLNGYWTDITRTYTLGQPQLRARRIYEAIFEARQAALEAIQPGVEARTVDEAARSVLAAHGFGKEFKHSTGHGVGFAAISANAKPQIHPQSHERLAPGMVFNVEPAVYIDAFGGVRHCDMVAVTDTAYELLTPFQTMFDELIIAL